jgi:hypothetical protein
MIWRFFLWLSAAVLLAASPVRAAGPFDLTVDYSADSTVGSGDHARLGRLWRTRQALRHESTEQGQSQIIIARLDRGLAWLVVPALRVSIETDIGGLGGLAGLLGGAGKAQPLGSETVEGQRAGKYRVTVDDAKAGRFDGLVWSTGQGVVLRIDGEGEHAGQRGRVLLSFRNIRIGPQDDALFEPPSGFNRVRATPQQIETMLKGIEQLQRLMGGSGTR